MRQRSWWRAGAGAAAGAGSAFALGWAGWAAVAYARHGRVRAPGPVPALDALLPTYDLHERHETRVPAPVDETWAAAQALDFRRSPIVRAIFGVRERLLGAAHDPARDAPTFLAEAEGMGWRRVAESAPGAPGRLVVYGAVTRPWEAQVTFRGMSGDAFARFAEPRYVRILWTLEVMPLGGSASLLRTETRVATTDAEARRRFRRYWSVFSPGILLIRREALRLVRADAERRARQAPA